MSRPDERSQTNWLENLGKDRSTAPMAFFGAAVLLLLIPILMGYFYRWQYVAVGVWGGLLALLALGAGLWLKFRDPQDPAQAISDATAGRLLVLVFGGLAGLFTFLLGLWLTGQWWEEVFAGGLEKWRAGSDKVFYCLLAQLGGLVVMFLAMQVVRGEEHADYTLRVLLYGYNAVLSGILLLYVLGIVNVLPYADLQSKPVVGRLWTFLNTPIDWTKRGQFTLKQPTIASLRTLSKPVKVYAIVSAHNEWRRDVEVLLNNCRAYTDKLTVEYLSPDLESDYVKQLAKDYKISAREGLLVVVGSKPSEEHVFIELDSMVTNPSADRFSQQDRNRSVFNGEFFLIRRINLIVREDRAKPIVYFTQGHGEPSLTGFQAKDPIRLSTLKGAMDDQDWDVKELPLGPAAMTSVPDEASIVVIIRPTQRFDDASLKALRDFMNRPAKDKVKKGKMAVFLDVIATPDGKMIETGLEGLLAEFSVQVGNDHILSLQSQNPTQIEVAAEPNNRTELGKAFVQMNLALPLSDVRTIQPMGAPGAGGRYRAEPLYTVITPRSWAEPNLGASPTDLVKDLSRPERKEEAMAKIKPDLPVAVTVVEAPPPERTGDKEVEEPRLVVVGDAGWLDNTMIQRTRGIFFSIFQNMLLWLRGRPDLGEVPDIQQGDTFQLAAKTDEYSIRFLAGILTVIGIIAVSGGVWFVRRR